MTTGTDTPHLDDGQLADLLFAPPAAGAARHLLGCRDCTGRLDALRRESAQLRALIAEIDLPADFSYPALPLPLRPRQRRWTAVPPGGWRAAAAVALLLVGGAIAAVPPLRAWVADRVAALWGEPAPAPEPRDPVQSPLPAGEGRGSTVSFTPGGEELVLEVRHRQSAGRLILRPTTAPEVSVEVVDGGGDEVPMVQESGLRVLNRPHSRADYVVEVPRSIRRVWVRIGRGAAMVLEREDLAAGRSFELR